jgi:putative ABC transport system permease protein
VPFCREKIKKERMGVIWHKVWHDLWGSPIRTALAVISIAAGVASVGAIFGMVDQLLTGMDRSHQAVDPSHVNIILRAPISESVIADLRSIPGVAGIEPVNLLSVRYRVDGQGEWRLGTVVHRPDYENQVYDRVQLQLGNWPKGGQVGLERLSGQHLDLAVGDSVTFRVQGEEKSFPISGLIRHPFVQPPLFGGQSHFFMDSEALEDTFGIPEGYFGQLFLRVTDYSLERAQNIAGDVRSRLGEEGYTVAVMLYQEPDRHWGRMFVEGVNLVLRVMAVVTLLMSVVLVLNTFTALITQETDQIGIIKAIGGRRATIIQIYLAGALAYGLLALLHCAAPGSHLCLRNDRMVPQPV